MHATCNDNAPVTMAHPECENAPGAVALASPRRLHNGLLWIVVVGLLTRLALLPHFQGIGPGTFDEKQFNELAVSLLERGTFAYQGEEPNSMRPPLYAFLVAGVYAITGLENYQAVRFVQILLNILTVVVVYYLARELFERRTATVAALLCMLYPSLWGHSYLLLTEVSFTFWLCLALLCLVRFFRHDRLAYLTAGAVFLGLAALTRSAMFLFPPACLVLILCACRLSWGRRLTAALLFLVTFSAVLTPWVIRNTRLERTLTFVESRGGRILLWAVNIEEANEAAKASGVALPTGDMTQGERDHSALRRALVAVLHRPMRLLEHTVANFFQFWQLDRELLGGMASGAMGNVPRVPFLLLACVICGLYIFCLLTGVFGALLFPARDTLCNALLLLTIGHLCLLHSLVYGHSRYHIPVMPLIGLFAASFLINRRAMFARGQRVRLVAAGAICCMFIASWGMRFFEYNRYDIRVMTKKLSSQ